MRKKMSSKIASVVLSAAMAVTMLAGCQNNGTSTGEQSEAKQTEQEEEKKEGQLDFNDISWEAYYGVEDNRRYMLMDITNNSDYVITEIDFTYSEKEGVTDEERTKFIEEWSELSEMSVEELHDWNYDKIEFSANYDENINPGDVVTAHFYYLHGIYYLMNEDQFNLSAPDYAEIEYVAEDTGSAIKGNRIDIFCEKHNECFSEFCNGYKEVFVKEN